MVMIRTPVLARAFFSCASERPSSTPFSAKSLPDLGHLHPEVGGQLQELGKGEAGGWDATSATAVHAGFIDLLVLALVEDHGTDDDPAPFYDSAAK